MSAKRAILHVLKAAGLFALSRRLTRNKLRILCYHGFAMGDQHRYNPMLFMTPETFAARMRSLASAGYPVVSLQEGLSRLAAGKVEQCETVITIDDGWYTTFRFAVPTLKSLRLPATIYSTTYNSERGTDVFTVAINYLLWRRKPRCVTIQGVSPHVDGTYEDASHQRIADELIKRGEASLTSDERQLLVRTLAASLGIEPEAIGDRRFGLMTPEELAELARTGIDLQLHTHRHRLSMTERAEVEREIRDNRSRLQTWCGIETAHFCYPSGRHRRAHGEWLRSAGVESATTCEPGLNRAGDDPFFLRRFLDSEALSQIEFEAELSGLMPMIRSARDRLRAKPADTEQDLATTQH